jgi:hypothetical protein
MSNPAAERGMRRRRKRLRRFLFPPTHQKRLVLMQVRRRKRSRDTQCIASYTPEGVYTSKTGTAPTPQDTPDPETTHTHKETGDHAHTPY